MRPFYWMGRVTLWVVFWPLGLWRSIGHGRRKHERRVEEIMRRGADMG